MNEHLSELWEMIYNELKNHIPVGDSSIKLWFGTIQLRYISESTTIYFSIDNYLKKKFIEEHYIDGFCAAIKTILGFDIQPVLICTERESFEDQFAELVASESEDMKKPVISAKEQEEEKQQQNFDEMTAMRSVFPLDEISESPATTPNTLDEAIHKGINAPKRYNRISGKMEEMPLSEYINNNNSGVLMMSPSTPAFYPSYTFENFVVGNSNRFAYQYALQASRYPAQQYNPLYIYGAPGLGKTHLLYAITNEIMRLHPSFNIIYVKGDDFTNELVEALQKRTPIQFRDKYRNADVLLVDDIQFIAGRESTQEEFFHTYNALYETGKQIIMTSDKPPKDIAKLEERLRSRFEGGPIVKIDPPDIELRTAIIKKKFEQMKIDIPNEVIMFLSENIKDNVRQIEGVIKKMNAYCLMCNQKITLELAEKAISDVINLTSKIDERKILSAASEKYGIPVEHIVGKKQKKEIVWARHMAIYVIKQLLDLTYSDIGRIFGGRDHTTIMASDNKIKKMSEDNPSVEKEIQELIDIVKLKA